MPMANHGLEHRLALEYRCYEIFIKTINVIISINNLSILECGAIGQDFYGQTETCPGNCPTSDVWGSGFYLSGSSICSAAVHAGVIDAAAGGEVKVSLSLDRGSYTASSSNGVTSMAKEAGGENLFAFTVAAPSGTNPYIIS